jgi:UDPglucose--hexose-1-phosphate uridylyltransferase
MSIREYTGGELRRDQWTNEWVIVAPGRALRHREAAGPCPFCPGPGEDTAPEHWRMSTSDGVGWRVRSVANRYALSDRHEVLIESPHHGWDLTTATTTEVVDVLTAWQKRHRALRDGAAEVVIFRNKGVAAGTSLPHPHSQVLGLPVLSAVTTRNLTVAREHYQRLGRRLIEDIVESELAHERRIVYASAEATAFVPAAPAAEFEMCVVPSTYRADFDAATRPELTAVAASLRTVLAAMRVTLDDPAYNLVLHTAPMDWAAAPFLAWYLRVLPRLSTPAGLEVATGIPVLTIRPEDCATRLRAALPVDVV